MKRQRFFRSSDGHQLPIDVRVADNWECRMNALAITAAVFVGEEGGSLDMYIGGNDFTSTYLLAFVDGQPVGTVRLRFFAEFARIERLAILKRFRQLSVANALGATALSLSLKKGYTYACGLGREDVVKFWKRFGGYPKGEPVESEYGRVVPIIIPLNPNAHDTEPFRASELGIMDFEWRLVHEFEGAGIS